MSGSENGRSLPADGEGVLVHQNIINGSVYFFAKRNGVAIEATEISENLPEDFLDIFDKSHELGSEQYIKSCAIIGLEPITVDFLIPETDIKRLRRDTNPKTNDEQEIVDYLLKLAMVIPNGFEIVGDEYDKDKILKTAKTKILYATRKKEFNIEWYEELLSRLEKIIKNQ